MQNKFSVNKGDLENRCEEILEEYQILKRRIEELELGKAITAVDLNESGITSEDLRRIEEIEKELDSSCKEILPKYDKVDIPLDNGYFSSSRRFD